MRKNKGITTNQITEGVIWKQLLFFFFPILLGTFFQQLYNTVDMVIVGRFVGKEALASVGGSAGQIITLVVGFFTGLAAGAGVIISQFYGARDKANVNAAIHTAYAFSLVGSLIILVLGIWLSPEILRMMNTPTELMADSTLYIRIYFGGIVFTFIYNIGSGILRALGDSKRPLYYLIICCILNIVLDFVMVLWFHMGIAGVAIATVLAQAFSAWLVTWALMKPTEMYQLKLREIRFHPNVLRSQLYVGLPGGFQSTTYNLSNIIIQAAINAYGTDTTAAWAAYGKLDAIFWMVSSAFGVAITTFVGQNYGAGKYERIKRSIWVCLGMDFFVSVILTAGLIVFRYPLFAVFTSDANVVQIGSDMLKLITPWYIVFVVIEVLSSALRGLSDVIVPMLLTLGGVCALRIVWTLMIVPLFPSIEMVIVSYPITWITTAVLFIIYYAYKRKKLFPAE